MNTVLAFSRAARWAGASLILMATVTFTVPLAGSEPAKAPEEGPARPTASPLGRGQSEGAAKKTPPPGAVEVSFINNRALKLVLRNVVLELITPHGILHIPIADIQQLEFATRVTEEESKRIHAAVANLGNADFRTREAASAELANLGEKAYPALREAAKSTDAEVRRRATNLLAKVRETFADEDPGLRKHDVVYTADSKIAGRIGATTLKGDIWVCEMTLQVSDLRNLRRQGVEPDVTNAAADPGNLMAFQNQIGKAFVFKVTGAARGALWGTDVYTTDSALAAAAVHAGILKPGQTGIVRVTIVAAPASFEGSTRHGVTSAAWGPFSGAFRVKK